MRAYEDQNALKVAAETALIEQKKVEKLGKVQDMHEQSRVHAIETQRIRIQDIKDRQAEEREYVKRIKAEISDVADQEKKKKEIYHTRME